MSFTFNKLIESDEENAVALAWAERLMDASNAGEVLDEHFYKTLVTLIETYEEKYK